MHSQDGDLAGDPGGRIVTQTDEGTGISPTTGSGRARRSIFRVEERMC